MFGRGWAVIPPNGADIAVDSANDDPLLYEKTDSEKPRTASPTFDLPFAIFDYLRRVLLVATV